MMILDFPPEVLLIIVKKLDFISIESMYNTCSYFRDIVRMQDAVQYGVMSKNKLATVKSLKSEFFNDIAGHLRELDMCGISDLYKSHFYPVLNKFKCLITLDISYTYLNLPELRQICRTCPTVRNVSINVTNIIPRDLLQEYQNDLKQLENVHFVGPFQCYNLVVLLLQKAQIDTFKFTGIGMFSKAGNLKPNCKKLYMYSFRINNTEILGSLWWFRNLNNMFEYIIINRVILNKYLVYSSPLFSNFFNVQFGLDTELIDIEVPLKGNTALLVFDREINNFDDQFFQELFCEIKQYLPYFCRSNTKTPVTTNSDWVYVTPAAINNGDNNVPKENEPITKKNRIGESNCVLNYDELLKEKKKVKLSIGFKDHNVRNPIELSASNDYIQKLTFLSLSGKASYTLKFFHVLFQNAINLETLDIECQLANPQCILDLSKYLPLTKSLKNINVIGSRIKFNALFKSLSELQTIEFIYIEDTMNYTLYCNEIPFEFGDPTIMIDKCDKLCSLYIQAPVSDKARAHLTRKLSKAKIASGKCYLNLVFLCKYFEYSYISETQTFPKDRLPFDIFRNEG